MAGNTSKSQSPDRTQIQSTTTPSPCTTFLSQHPHYIRLFLSHRSPKDDLLIRFLHLSTICLAKETIRFLTSLLAPSPEEAKRLYAVLWPSLLAYSDSEAQISASVRQFRGSFLIGLTLPPSKSQNADADHHLVKNVLEPLFGDFKASVTRHAIWTDESERAAPKLGVSLVSRAQMEREQLVPDAHMWPRHPESRPLLVRARAGILSWESFADRTENVNGLSVVTTALQTPGKKLRPASDVLHRLLWDESHDADDYDVVYLDRFAGFQSLPVARWKADITDDEFVPLHRITTFQRRGDGEVVWHREGRVDRIFG